MEQLIISLIAGAVGGNVAGAAIKKISLGTLGNSIAGILGGGLGAQILSAAGLGAALDGSTDLTAILSSVASGGVGGGVVLAAVGVVKSLLSK